MDPYKGGITQDIISFFLNIILHTVYFFLKLIYKNSSDEIVEPLHLNPPPDKPIPSLKLAYALNPETPVAKLSGLVDEEDIYIKRAICRNPALPKKCLEKLADDENPLVSNEAKLALGKRFNFDPKGYKLPAI